MSRVALCVIGADNVNVQAVQADIDGPSGTSVRVRVTIPHTRLVAHDLFDDSIITFITRSVEQHGGSTLYHLFVPYVHKFRLDLVAA